MNKSIRTLFAITIAGTLLPIAIGALKTFGLSRAADGNSAMDFADSYYREVTQSAIEQMDRRAEFAQTGYNGFGLKVREHSVCQRLLGQSDRSEDDLVAYALAAQQSLVLEDYYDWRAMSAVYELPSSFVGALKGCRYTLLATACDALGRKTVDRAIQVADRALQKEKREWLQKNEAASCKAVTKFGYDLN